MVAVHVATVIDEYRVVGGFGLPADGGVYMSEVRMRPSSTSSVLKRLVIETSWCCSPEMAFDLVAPLKEIS